MFILRNQKQEFPAIENVNPLRVLKIKWILFSFTSWKNFP